MTNSHSTHHILQQMHTHDGPGPAPVHLWNPPLSGDIDIEILADGQWLHEGSPIQRHELIRLFCRILKREGSEFFLVTPVEKWRIRVQAAPLWATQIDIFDEHGVVCIRCTTANGESVTLSKAHPLRVEDSAQGPAVFVMIRDGLEAKLCRTAYYALIEQAEPCLDAPEHWCITSAGSKFRVG